MDEDATMTGHNNRIKASEVMDYRVLSLTVNARFLNKPTDVVPFAARILQNQRKDCVTESH
jgi:hypothetical protein